MRPVVVRGAVGRWSLLIVVLALASARGGLATPTQTLAETTIHITSPRGRTSFAGTVRIVAHVETPPGPGGVPPGIAVRFLVDGALVGTAEAGPPYAVEWIDENPFEARDIVAEATDAAGVVARDTVRLPPFEIADRTEVTRVLLDAGVYDQAGRAVPEVGRAAFVVREDGVVQPIDVAVRRTLAMTVVLLVDNSQSMSRRMADVRRAAERLTRALRGDDRVIVAPFNARVGAITDSGADARTIADAIDAMRAGGGTAILDAVADAARLLDGTDGLRTVILITDGYDENSALDLRGALARVEATGATVYTVGIGGVSGMSLPGERLLRTLASSTGGRAYFPSSDSDLTTISRTVAADAASRYLISYTPTNQRRDGQWRAIAVDAGEGLRVRTREGYRAALPPPIRPEIEFSLVNASRESVEIALDDFDVFESGVRQSPDAFQEAVDPVSLVLALDGSGSMRRAAESVRRTAADFIAAVRPADRLALVTFADAPRLAHVLGIDRRWSQGALAAYVPAGGTALYDGLWTSLQHLRPEPGRRAIVVLSDGRDEDGPGTAPGSTHTLAEVLALTREVGAAIFSIGLGERVDRSVLERLARESGGQAFLSRDPAELGAHFQLVVDNLRRRYIVSYTSTNPVNDGLWRTVDIRPRRDGLTVAAQGGYFAPDP